MNKTPFPSEVFSVACEQRAGGLNPVSCVYTRKPLDLGLISLFVSNPHRGARNEVVPPAHR